MWCRQITQRELPPDGRNEGQSTVKKFGDITGECHRKCRSVPMHPPHPSAGKSFIHTFNTSPHRDHMLRLVNEIRRVRLAQHYDSRPMIRIGEPRDVVLDQVINDGFTTGHERDIVFSANHSLLPPSTTHDTVPPHSRFSGKEKCVSAIRSCCGLDTGPFSLRT